MKRIAMVPLTAALTLVLAAPGFGQTEVKSAGQAQGSATTQTEAVTPSGTGTQTQAQAQAQAEVSAEAKAEVRKKFESIKQKGAKVSTEARAKTDAKLEATAKSCNDEARAQGDAMVASRLAADFGMTADQLMAEQKEAACSWGNLMIAHSLKANTKADVTAGQLLALHGEGVGWGQIAAGLGLKLGEVVSAVQAEGKVATGLVKPDGKVAVIRGEGARAGVGAQAGTKAGVPGAGAQVGAGVGVKIKP